MFSGAKLYTCYLHQKNILKDKWLIFKTSTSFLCRFIELKHNDNVFTYCTDNHGLIKFIENTKRALYPKTVHHKFSSLTAFINFLRIVIEHNSSDKEFHTLAPIKVVDFKPKFVVFLRGTTSLLVPLKHFTLSRTTNKSLIYPGDIPFTTLKINMAMSCRRRLDKVKP